ncbi:MAG: hypothetical protein LBJ71_01070 [Holosporaceae bacterium]|jgi:hypothetical protein|nr:hypothetical protein [Holosporaceae bacterium]
MIKMDDIIVFKFMADPQILEMMKYFLLANDEKDVCVCTATPLQDSDPKDLA